MLTAEDGRSGVETFRTNVDKISAILLDLTMPDLSGEDVLREIRTVRPDVRVVLTSAYDEQETIGQFQGKGLAGFIQKPCQAEKLLASMRAALNPGVS